MLKHDAAPELERCRAVPRTGARSGARGLLWTKECVVTLDAKEESATGGVERKNESAGWDALRDASEEELGSDSVVRLRPRPPRSPPAAAAANEAAARRTNEGSHARTPPATILAWFMGEIATNLRPHCSISVSGLPPTYNSTTLSRPCPSQDFILVPRGLTIVWGQGGGKSTSAGYFMLMVPSVPTLGDGSVGRWYRRERFFFVGFKLVVTSVPKAPF